MTAPTRLVFPSGLKALIDVDLDFERDHWSQRSTQRTQAEETRHTEGYVEYQKLLRDHRPCRFRARQILSFFRRWWAALINGCWSEQPAHRNCQKSCLPVLRTCTLCSRLQHVIRLTRAKSAKLDNLYQTPALGSINSLASQSLKSNRVTVGSNLSVNQVCLALANRTEPNRIVRCERLFGSSVRFMMFHRFVRTGDSDSEISPSS